MKLTTCLLYLLAFAATATAVPMAGDVDGSQTIDALDVQFVVNAALARSTPHPTDLDLSGGTDAMDVQLVVNAVLARPVDSDSDGLTDAGEGRLGTNPQQVDTDGDGIGDGQEWLDGTNPLVPEGDSLPPDPADVAPALDPSSPADLASLTAFLYTGDYPIQRDAAPGTIDPRQAAVLRGRVIGRTGAVLPGVRVTVLGHPEFGHTLTRADGAYDLAVNGGTSLVLSFTKEGYLPAQRSVQVPWQNFVQVPDCALGPVDAAVTAVDLSEPAQAARAGAVTDDDGTRRATLLFPQDAAPALVHPDGSTEPLTALHVRATEYTVGPGGPQAMPAELPPSSGYTYCVDLTADEALDAGAKGIRFEKPVPFYVENFLGFPVGMAVPAGYYDYEKAAWIASKNGLVISIVSETGGAADVDITGDNVPDEVATLGMDDAERRRLAEMYEPGQSLWRVPVDHFSPWDCNWPYGPTVNDKPPQLPPPTRKYVESDEPGETSGMTTRYPNGVLGAKMDIPSTTFKLHYRSDRVPGCTASYTLDIPLKTAEFLDTVLGIELEVLVAGRYFTRSLPRDTPSVYTHTWDRLDAYDRRLYGSQRARVSVGYVYPATYQTPAEFDASFALLSGVPVTGNRTRMEVILWQRELITVGAWDARAAGLGGWTVDVHHAYDTATRQLLLGDGSVQRGESLGRYLYTAAGSGTAGSAGDEGPAIDAEFKDPTGVAVMPDGSLLVCDAENNRIRRIDRDGIIRTVAGTGEAGFAGDGGDARDALLRTPIRVAAAPDGGFYFADRDNQRVRRVRPDGVIETVAGSGPTGLFMGGYGGDNGPATEALLNSPHGVALAPDGTLYIADTENDRIRRVGTDGIITTVAGGGDDYGDAIPATQAILFTASDVAVGPGGDVFVSDGARHRIRRIGPDGIIRTFAGTSSGFEGDGEPAVFAKLFFPSGIAVGPDGTVYFSDTFNYRVRMVTPDGIINTIAGSGSPGYGGDGGLGTDGSLNNPLGVAVAPDGAVYIADSDNNRVRRVEHPYPVFTGSTFIVPSADGMRHYRFNANGRHLQTLDAATSGVIMEFEYDDRGRLAAVKHGSGTALLTVQRADDTHVTLVPMAGPSTELTLDAAGFLASVDRPGGDRAIFVHAAQGLLEQVTDFDGTTTHDFTYDEWGLLEPPG